MAGPDTVSPGRRWRASGSSLNTASPGPIDTMVKSRPAMACGKCKSRNADTSLAVILGVSGIAVGPSRLVLAGYDAVRPSATNPLALWRVTRLAPKSGWIREAEGTRWRRHSEAKTLLKRDRQQGLRGTIRFSL